MFDYHMHTRLSYDSEAQPEQMVLAARAAGLKEICFTDHVDYELDTQGNVRADMMYRTEDYSAAYDHLSAPDITIRRGVELGMTPWNKELMRQFLAQRHYDFVLGSIHHIDNFDPYYEAFWVGKTLREAEIRYFEVMLECVRLHDDYDVLGHLNYICKTPPHPTHVPFPLSDYAEFVDEILKTLVAKGKGMEVNTSGVDRCGDFLPGAEFLRRFKELGGEIVTVGSDAHAPDRVGQYTDRACQLVQEIFGHVCTFQDRKPIFHKL